MARSGTNDTDGPETSAEDLVYIDKMVFGGLWERPDLTPKERSLITITAAICLQDLQKLEFHLGFFEQNGGTDAEIEEVLKHLSFYLDEAIMNKFLPGTRQILARLDRARDQPVYAKSARE